MDDDTGKRCTKCGTWRPWSEFSPRTDRPSGIQSWCKSCNREAANERSRRWHASNPEKYRERKRQAQRRYAAAHPEFQRNRWQELKDKVFGHYGNQCACCGTAGNLSIDHVDGGGSAHRLDILGKKNASGTRFYLWLIREGFPDGFQVLCLPCNKSKGDGAACRLHSPPRHCPTCTCAPPA